MGDLAERTIADFGEQWQHFRANEGWYASPELFLDAVHPFLDRAAIAGQRVLDVGSGTGRIVGMLLGCGAGHVEAVEPSSAYDVMLENLGRLPPELAARVTTHRVRGEELRVGAPVDLAVSIGVLHHIPEPAPVVARMREALRPGGRCVVWLYGKEGNGAYLALTQPLRAVTTKIPHKALLALSTGLERALRPYVALARRVPVPLAGYLTRVYGPMAPHDRQAVIYDQLNPGYAKYYTRAEAIALLADAGFARVEVHHRHGYSWTVTGVRA